MSYTADSIDVLEGLDPVKKRPGMYTETNRPNHLAQEVIDNSVDEALANEADTVSVTVHSDGSLCVVDNGRGMPIDMHKKKKKPGYEVILTSLHSGGKFDKNNYKFSGGLHGVGVSVVNALSSKLHLTVWKSGEKLDAFFENGSRKSEERDKASKHAHGTSIRFWPNPVYFDNSRFNRSSLTQLLRTKAILCPGLTVQFHDEESDERIEWFYENGMSEFFQERQASADEPTPEKGWSIHASWSSDDSSDQSSQDDCECDLVMSFSGDGVSVLSDSFANLIPTPQGGTHVNAVRNGIAQAVRQVADQRSLAKGTTLTLEDIAGAVNLMVSVKLSEPRFAGQTKEKLSNREFIDELSRQVRDKLEQIMNQNPEDAEAIVQIAVDRSSARTKASKRIKRKKATSGLSMPSKLSDCTESSVNTSELFLVEGDSAGGSAKQARDRTFQAIMPLRGKIMNTWDVDPVDLFSSKEIADIATIIGVEPGSDDLKGLRYNRICVLADADSDGLHIATLLCALFYRHFTPIVDAGHFYAAMPPLYRIDQGKDVYYAHDEAEKDTLVKKLNKSNKKGAINIQRFKGLGEMNPSQLKETVMQPGNRKLVQITVDDAVTANIHMDMLLGKKNASQRHQWLQEKGGRVFQDQNGE